MIDLTTLANIDPDEAARRLAKMRADEQIQTAVLAEREACAKIAEAEDGGCSHGAMTANRIAAKIRGRK